MPSVQTKVAALFGVVLLSVVSLGASELKSIIDEVQQDDQRLRIKPIFFVPKGGLQPGKPEIDKLRRHIVWAQERYCEMLFRRDTFGVANYRPETFLSKFTEDKWRDERLRWGDVLSLMTDEWLDENGYSRKNSPYVLFFVFCSEDEPFFHGAGSPFYSKSHRGAGAAGMALWALTKENFNFQNTLQHELGHAFGLMHPLCYGIDMFQGISIMSYREAHKTVGFEEAPEPGILTPEDLLILDRHDRLLPLFKYNKKADAPDDYRIRKLKWKYRFLKFQMNQTSFPEQ